jgi:hypothetical protein
VGSLRHDVGVIDYERRVLLISRDSLNEGGKVDHAGHGSHAVIGQQFVRGRKGLRMTTTCRSGCGSGNGLLCIQTCSRVRELSDLGEKGDKTCLELRSNSTLHFRACSLIELEIVASTV